MITLTWIEPKTNWQNDDYFNLEDFLRITTDLVILTQIHIAVQPNYLEIFDIEESYSRLLQMLNYTVESIPDDNDYNAWVDIADTDSIIYIQGGRHFFYKQELNEIESANLKEYEVAKEAYDHLPQLELQLGQEGFGC